MRNAEASGRATALVQLHHPDVAVGFPKIGYNLVPGHPQFRLISVAVQYPPLRIVEVLNHERRVYRALRAPVEMLRPDAEIPVPLGSEIQSIPIRRELGLVVGVLPIRYGNPFRLACGNAIPDRRNH